MPPSYADDLALAHVLADSADAVTMRHFRSAELEVTRKADQTLVTNADISAEETIRSVLKRARPRDAVLGEEQGFHSGARGHGRCWIIDPINGTQNYLRGVPVWATLIALLDGDDVVVGLVSAPGLGRRWWAAHGSGAYAGRHASAAKRIRVSTVAELSAASLCYSSLHSWDTHGRFPEFLSVTKTVGRTRAFGDFYGYVLVAEGAVDVMAEPELALWELAALVPIITEAGGTWTDLAGQSAPLGSQVHGPHGGVATNGPLHQEVLTALTPPAD